MYRTNYIDYSGVDGLGRFKLRFGKKKKRVAAAPAPEPAPVTPVIQQPAAPVTPAVPAPMMTTMPVPSPAPVPYSPATPAPMYRQAEPEYEGGEESATYQVDTPTYSGADYGSPFDTASMSPTMVMQESSAEQTDDDYIQGLAEGSSWTDIFTGAASEILASQKAKREAKAVATQQAAAQKALATQYRPIGGAFGNIFTPQNIMIIGAVGLGGILLLKMLRKKR